MVLTLEQLDATPDGWAEELACQSAGWEAAVQLLSDREKRKSARRPQQGGRPVYGARGAVLLDGGQGVSW